MQVPSKSLLLVVRLWLMVKRPWTAYWTAYWDQRYVGQYKPRKTVEKEIKHWWQRYNTVGDYYYTMFGTLVILVSDLGDWRYNYVIKYHEKTEVPQAWHAGITFREVDEFDLAYEAKRAPGDTSEAGDDPDCPYYAFHQDAMEKERDLTRRLDVDPDDVQEKIDELMTARESWGLD
ncbi:hypothetical protein H6786_01475 [Candidatus Nomurabacteria bacterium]|nr:hypothetical protein [Candidatus Nomurabacteria bacterium]